MTVVSHADLLVSAAGDYLSRGLRIIALTGKTPNVRIHKHGLYDHLVGAPEGEDDWLRIRRIFEHEDTTGIGILTGQFRVVVDIDGDEGAQQWVGLVADEAFDTARWVAKTGRGLHLWYGCMTPTGTIKLGPKLDLKGDGGYVAAPPSIHPDGGMYEWLLAPGDEPLFELPEGAERLVAYHAAQKERRIGGREQRKPIPVTARFGGVDYTSVPSFDGIIKAVREAADGNRNNALHWAAATMAEEGAMSEDFEQLAEAALAVGLEREETKRTIRSAARLVGG